MHPSVSIPARLFQIPPLTPRRVRLAYAVALATDVLQFLLGPVGWLFADQVLDVVAAILTWRILGFHLLLLPTVALELFPATDMLPTWTGCVAVVVALRRKAQGPSRDSSAAAPAPPASAVDAQPRP